MYSISPDQAIWRVVGFFHGYAISATWPPILSLNVPDRHSIGYLFWLIENMEIHLLSSFSSCASLESRKYTRELIKSRKLPLYWKIERSYFLAFAMTLSSTIFRSMMSALLQSVSLQIYPSLLCGAYFKDTVPLRTSLPNRCIFNKKMKNEKQRRIIKHNGDFSLYL